MEMKVTKVTFECNQFHLNIDGQWRDILIPINTNNALELFNMYPEQFSTAAKMEVKRLTANRP